MIDDVDHALSPYKKAENYAPVFFLFVILAAIAWVGLKSEPGNRDSGWLLILGLMSLFAVLVGYGITNKWRGILIDSRNKMSLSRLQLVVWTLVVLSALVAAVLGNVAMGWESPLEITIPSQLWILMGISTASAVSSPAVLSTVAQRKVAMESTQELASQKKESDGVDIDTRNQSTVVRNKSSDDARWGDLLKGDEVGNANSVDLGKLQMFFFTFILVLGYGAAIGAMFNASWPIVELPAVQEGMNVLLGISQTGYLASKAVSPTTM